MNWISEKGKNAWVLMMFLFSLFMPTIIPSIWIMTEFDIRFGHPCGAVGFLYLGVTTLGIFYLWDRFYFKKKENPSKG